MLNPSPPDLRAKPRRPVNSDVGHAMSYELMSSETDPCWCGLGTITCIFEMDDWNRSRKSCVINCPHCKAKEEARVREQQKRLSQKESLYEQAKLLATERYLEKWVEQFSGLTKKAAWERYTGGQGYPALGTFYSHLKDQTLEQYMRWTFRSKFEDALEKMKIVDEDIEALLRERDSV